MKQLFVIGDSISCYYGRHLERMLVGVMAYDRKGGSHRLIGLDDCTDGVNGGDSSMVLTYLTEVVNQDWFAPDILLLNCGIHDTKRNQETGELQMPLPAYSAKLNRIIDLAKRSGAAPVWVRTTPLNPEAHRPENAIVWHESADIDNYNTAADQIMADRTVPVIDLFSFTRKLGEDIYLNGTDHVHFNDTAAAQQAAFLAGWLAQFKS
ncbi:MAG: SGNH/GDSL hydrolase family protein [Lentisphaerae bacterium]|jgi:lysophospholipase L1-like esterase|nr:SGNH/GDSL hydrolase family protein [Lentisphaerota bacterium]MBT4821452.1 SGNH/GDSL hydrolase family protein [Lentisphaerota bacterium]MBT5607650.1 SGNH/GDSL hydrolase family protein [Lentisphaerota bacterium]MBT7054111.1 SGNH/GDSL hydrolase family protein [Lentisphaerota bacterium]MBT7845150.1 SGNH/GDSL hydrolase family protein [Lentisphaerota bacterium]